ncbi:3-methyl-2-oxobutanoate hydroxymethyltransferase [Hoeflea prorocentri]|uniref:3-methyl-2-oxobutanoate hydroxymethyltransferase n=1 Tax=Hoeflea prorocentri TaxID=1922333 RepID=A0A9X3ZHW4_9HYPH|nr:3-methyl-2-oxobutanoate hydroxymethyltransferase [Hoeflea prorocentri]MCY6381779.1 3-methyl-2-oxobutanoate hydroxymethyltransferase [Hoeflea prorocentri]MDA5399579.1 3-methyl-2-oxobutanoate hydroxymethyltransferase [Hoeflea prorocentri]
MTDRSPTVADMLAAKGKRQLTKLRVETMDEAAAANAASIDMLSVPPELILKDGFRDACPAPFVVGGLEPGLFITQEDYLRIAFKLLNAGANAVYCGASLPIVRRLRDEGIPVVGHVGLIPSRRTWTGGFKAVGKTAKSALWVWEQTKALEEAGAFAAEIEVVPPDVASAISAETGMLMISMGAGGGCDAQYLFACDILGTHEGHYPRHARKYRDLMSEYARLQEMRVEAFREYAADVASAQFPGSENLVPMDETELKAFLEEMKRTG